MEQRIVLDTELAGDLRGSRRWRTVEQKRQIVEETLVPGVSVASVARRHQINANQIFQWRRQYRADSLPVPGERALKLLPVLVTDSDDTTPAEERLQSSGRAIHVEFPGRALVTIEVGADPALAIAVIERLAR